MKTLLNLLPEEKKHEIERSTRGHFLLWQLCLLLFLEFFFFVTLIGIYFILDFQVKSIAASQASLPETAASQQADLRRYEDKFRGTNEAVDVVGKYLATHFQYGELFRLLERIQPEGVALREIVGKEYTVTLSGQAKARSDLLDFESGLKSSECVSRVNVPLSNLFSQTDIDFQLDFDMKPECLRPKAL